VAESQTTAGERRILADAPSGELVHLGDLSDEERVVSPDVIRRLCVGPESSEIDPRGIRIEGAHITGPLDLSFCTIPHPLRFEATTFDAAPELTDAHVPALWIDGSSLPGLQAYGIQTGSLSLESTEVRGEVDLQDARIGGQLNCSGATLTNEGETAFFADGAEIGGKVFFSGGFTATGAVTLRNARIGGQLDCSGATLTNKGDDAFVADGADITGSLFLNECSAMGTVRLYGAKIGGGLECSGAALINEGGYALLAEQAEITGSMRLNDGFSAAGAVGLSGATIGDTLDCSGATLTNEGSHALVVDGAEIGGVLFLNEGFSATGTVRLHSAKIGGGLECSGAALINEGDYALLAEQAEITGSVFLRDGFRATGGVRLTGARIGSEIDCSGARLTNEGDIAFFADGADITGSLFLNECSAMGTVRLNGAKIGGALECSGAALINEGDYALLAEQAEITGSMRLKDGFSAAGAVGLSGATIGGALDCSGATLTNEGSYALVVDGAEIGGNVLLGDGFSATGAVRLPNARIGGNLSCDRATLGNERDNALFARGVTVDGALSLHKVSVTGGVDLFRARATTLDDDLGQADNPLGSWRGVAPLVLDSFAYARFGHEAEWGSTPRRLWLQQTSSFQQGAWQQLIEVYRAQGRDDEATRTAIAMHNDRMRRAGLPRYRRWGRQVLRVTVGHGYRPWLAGIWAAAIISAFALVVWKWSGMFVPGTERLTGSPQPVAYAADTFLPIVDLGEAGDWTPTRWVRWVDWSVILLGWALTTIFVAGFTRIVRS
jgi:hypothetical protein